MLTGPLSAQVIGVTHRCHLPALRDHLVARSMGPRRVHFCRLSR
jgi:hypothetical protein